MRLTYKILKSSDKLGHLEVLGRCRGRSIIVLLSLIEDSDKFIRMAISEVINFMESLGCGFGRGPGLGNEC